MAGKTKLYPPLRLCAEKESLIERFETVEYVLGKMTVEEFLGYELGNALGQFEDILEDEYGISPKSRRGKIMAASMTSMLYANVFTTMILADWKGNKQVYCVPKEFYKMLAEAEDFLIEMSVFKYLPFETFYLEFQDHAQAEGVLVRFMPKTSELTFCIIFKENCDYVEGGLNGGFFSPSDNGSFKNFVKKQAEQLPGAPDDEGLLVIQEILKVLLQASMYLCTKTADIEENPVQKNIYKQSNVIRNRYAEIRKWDVGMRVVKEHKRLNREAQAQTHKQTAEGRKRPRQHWRKAHWHTYLVGPGRKERELKFIAPMLINDIGDDMPVVKHE